MTDAEMVAKLKEKAEWLQSIPPYGPDDPVFAGFLQYVAHRLSELAAGVPSEEPNVCPHCGEEKPTPHVLVDDPYCYECWNNFMVLTGRRFNKEPT